MPLRVEGPDIPTRPPEPKKRKKKKRKTPETRKSETRKIESKRVPTISKEKYGPPVPPRHQLKYRTPQGNALFGLLNVPGMPRQPTEEQMKGYPGFLDAVRGAWGEARGLPGAVGQIVSKTGKAAGKDIANLAPGPDPFPLYSTFRDPRTGELHKTRESHFYGGVSRVAPQILKGTARSAADIVVVGALTGPLQFGGKKLLPEGWEDRLTEEHKASLWRVTQAPISTIASAFWGAGALSKTVTVPAMATRMMKQNAGLTRPKALRHAERELRNPGSAQAKGIEGGMPRRIIKSQTGETVGRPWSRTPGGRTGQSLYDEITEQIDRLNPNYPFASSKRVASTQRRRDAQQTKADQAALTHLEMDLADILEGTGGRKPSRAKARRALGIHRPIREVAEGLIAALEGPDSIPIREAIESRIKSFEDTLRRSAGMEHLADNLEVLREKYRLAETDEDRSDIARELEQLSDQIDLNLGRDVPPVRGSPERRNAMKEWERRFGPRQAQAVVKAYDARARSANPEDPAAWYRQNLAEVTSENAADFMSRVLPDAAQYQTNAGIRRGLSGPRPRRGMTVDEAIDEASYWDSDVSSGLAAIKDGDIHFITAEEDGWLIHRRNENGNVEVVSDDLTEAEIREFLDDQDRILADQNYDWKDLEHRLLGGDELDEPPVFYSELQHQVNKLFSGKTQRMKAQSLKAQLRENISDAEWDAMGMEDFFARYHPTDRIPEEEVQEQLSMSMNAYNLDEIIYSSDVPNYRFADRWGGESGWLLNYRRPEGGDVYYELVMALGARQPGAGRDFTTGHWEDIDNPIVHIRFTVTTDNTGKRAILIDEIQSDWAAKARKRVREAEDAGELRSVMELEDLLDELDELKDQLYDDNPGILEFLDAKGEMALADDYVHVATVGLDEIQDYGGDPARLPEAQAAVDDAVRHRAEITDRWREAKANVTKEALDEHDRLNSERQQVLAEMNRAETEEMPEWKLKDSEMDAAVRRMMRFAHDADVDRIIIVPADFQAFRSLKLRETPSGRSIPDPEVGDLDWSEFSARWKEFERMDPDAMRAFIRARSSDKEMKWYFDLYEQKYPSLFEKHIGHKGGFKNDIISARYADQQGLVESDLAPTRAWVIDLGEEGRRRAAIPQRQFQRQPEWDALPRGATELMADGRRAQRLFEDADVDTVIHELAHISLHDIDAESRAIIEQHFGGSIAAWTDHQHEAFARAFEHYFRTGRAANVQLVSAFSTIAKWMRAIWKKLHGTEDNNFNLDPQIAHAFDRMLGYRGVPTILSKTERSQVRSQIESLTKALDLPLESDEYKHALEALEVISAQIEELGEKILTRNAPPELADAIREGLARRRDLVTTRMLEQGVLPERVTSGYESARDLRGQGPGRPDVRFTETTDYQAFNAALAANPRAWNLTQHTAEELADSRVYLSPDGQSGFAISPEGDLQNVFRNEGGVRGAGRAAVEDAVAKGAATLDAYDGFLPDMYADAGFVEVGRMRFVKEYAPEGMPEGLEPDVIFMARGATPLREPRYYDDWDEAKAASRAATTAERPQARGYFPQTSIWDIEGIPQAGPVRMAAVQDVVGAPRLEGKAVMRKPNRLIRYSTGEVLNDPAVLIRVLRSRMRFLNTLKAREELYVDGKPVQKGGKIPKYGVAVIRNPNVQPKKIRDDINAALRLPPERYAELEMRGKMDEIDEAEDLQEAAKDFFWWPGMPGPQPHWVSDAENVRTVPIQVARARLGDVFSAAPRGGAASVIGGLNAMSRLAAIYLPYGGARYVARNAAQNTVMMALTQPKALARIGRNHAKFKNDHEQLYNRIIAEGGTILGTALPEFNIRPKGRVAEGERYITERTAAAGSFLGKYADNPFRFSSWTRHAERYGYHGPEGYRRLLDDETVDGKPLGNSDVRETVMQRTRDDMIDFDALTPWEREVLSRYFYLWPFIRGISKWPFMYFREYPGRVAAASYLPPKEEDELSTGAVRDRLMFGERDFAWLDPTGPALENTERVGRILRGRDEVKLSAVLDMMPPHWREIVQSLTDKQGVTWKKAMANTYVPFASTINAINRGGSMIDQLDRFMGQSTEPPISVVKQRKGRAAEINKYLDKLEEDGLELSEENLQRLLTAHGAYEKYKELSARVEFGLRDQGKQPTLAADSQNHRKRAAVMFAVADEFYPGSIPLTLSDYDRMTPEGRKEFFKQVEKGLWGMRQEFLKQAKKKYGKDEEE